MHDRGPTRMRHDEKCLRAVLDQHGLRGRRSAVLRDRNRATRRGPRDEPVRLLSAACVGQRRRRARVRGRPDVHGDRKRQHLPLSVCARSRRGGVPARGRDAADPKDAGTEGAIVMPSVECRKRAHRPQRVIGSIARFWDPRWLSSRVAACTIARRLTPGRRMRRIRADSRLPVPGQRACEAFARLATTVALALYRLTAGSGPRQHPGLFPIRKPDRPPRARRVFGSTSVGAPGL
jgi:hypothetical protein